MTTEGTTETTTASSHLEPELKRCDRCGGHLPGTGIRREGHIYCCDLCAAGPGKKMMVRMVPAAVALLGVGLLLGWSVARNALKHHWR
jgi:hypothetical protein